MPKGGIYGLKADFDLLYPAELTAQEKAVFLYQTRSKGRAFYHRSE
jgi:hypothetical protein